jgi:hypothetical protein
LVSRAELDEICERMFNRGKEYDAKRDKLQNDHINKLNSWKLRVEVKPALYSGEKKFAYMSSASKAALDRGETYEEEGKTWRKNIVSKEHYDDAVQHFYYGARNTKVETAKRNAECGRVVESAALALIGR